MAATNAWTGLALASLLGGSASDPVQAVGGVIAATGDPGRVSQTPVASQSIVITNAAYVVPGASPGAVGCTLWTPGQDETRALTPFHATLPRIDLVTVQVVDEGSDTEPTTCDYVIQTGTPATSPVAPDLADGAVLLATLPVPAGAGSTMTDGLIVDNRVYTGVRNGVWPVPTRDRVAAPYAGVMIREFNVGKTLIHDGVGWEEIPSGAPIQKHGNFTITFASGAASGVITFPDGGFDGVPDVQLSCSAVTGNTATVINQGTITATQFSYIARLASGASYNGTVKGYWTATYG